MICLAKVGPDEWIHLEEPLRTSLVGQEIPHEFSALRVGARLGPQEFLNIWKGKGPPPSSFVEMAPLRRVLPLPADSIQIWAYGLTYPEHSSETISRPPLRFRKQVVPWLMGSDPLPWQAHLDFEAEFGLLLHRNFRDRFGFLILNDLTNRQIQLQNYDPSNLGPGFSLSKTFQGALQIGSSLIIGSESDWENLVLSLSLNGVLRQRVLAKHCLKTPSQIHHETFKGSTESDWALIATGTTKGTCFKAPSAFQKVGLLLRGGFSMNSAKTLWLSELNFLEPGDLLEFESEQLGSAKMQIAPSI